MSWAFWAYLTHKEQTVSGFKPTSYDNLRLNNVQDLFAPVQDSVARLTSAPQPGGSAGVVSVDISGNPDAEE